MKVQNLLETFSVPDKALEPAIPQGAKLFCSAKLAVQSGDFVVFSPNDGSPHFVRQYVIQQDGSLLLHATNRSFDSYVSSVEEIEASGRVLPILRVVRDMAAASRIDEVPGLSAALDCLPEKPAPKRDVATASPDDSSPASVSTDAESELLTFDEAKAALKVRRTKMYELLRGGELKALKVGKLWRVRRSSIKAYLAKADEEAQANPAPSK